MNNDSGKNKHLTPEDRIDIAEYLAKGDELQEDCQRMGDPHENKKTSGTFQKCRSAFIKLSQSANIGVDR